MFFSIGLTIVLLAANIIFNWRFAEKGIDELTMLHNPEFDEILEVPNTEQPPPPPPEVLKQPIIIEVPDEEVLEEVNIDLDVEVTEETVIEEIIFEEAIVEEKAEEIFQIVEHSPEPIGGIKAFYQYVNQNIKYPNSARRLNIEGRVFVKFVVDSDGYIKNVEAVKGIGGGCDEEAARIIANSPRWKPGKQRGKAVSVYMMLPITFVLQ
ncbi:MAG: energy transducer TonB [Reichenbachiella sp.]